MYRLPFAPPFWLDGDVRRFLSRLLATTLGVVLGFVIKTIFGVEIEEYWNGTVQPAISKHGPAWVQPLFDFLSTFWGGASATLLLLLLVHFTFLKYERKFNKLSPKEIQHGNAESDESGWVKALRSKPFLTIKQAACLIANTPPSRFDYSETANIIHDEIREAVVFGTLKTHLGLEPKELSLVSYLQKNPDALLEWRARVIDNGRPISSVDIAEFYAITKNEKYIENLGLNPNQTIQNVQKQLEDIAAEKQR